MRTRITETMALRNAVIQFMFHPSPIPPETMRQNDDTAGEADAALVGVRSTRPGPSHCNGVISQCNTAQKKANYIIAHYELNQPLIYLFRGKTTNLIQR
jgi:hypothetical protein